MSSINETQEALNVFRGWYQRGSDENCPKDHQTVCRNVAFPSDSEVVQRPGVLTNTAWVLTSNAIDFKLGRAKEVISTDGSDIYVDGVSKLTLSFTTSELATAILGDITFVTAKGGGTGSVNSVYLAYFSEFRKIAGYAPTAGSAMAHTQIGTGLVDAGVHNVAVIYETSSGFLTPPGPKVSAVFTPSVVTAPGGKRIELSNIPTGPAGTIYRHIIATRANSTEYFFVPGGRISDNITTAWNIDFLDTDLIASADYLFDLLEEIPGCAFLVNYRGRLVAAISSGGSPGVYASYVQEPETFDSVVSKIPLPTGRDFLGAFTLRDVLYITTYDSLFAVQDNGGDPSTWVVSPVEPGLGAFLRGISTLRAGSGPGDLHDTILLANSSGLYIFDGILREPPLTWKIESYWKTLNHYNFGHLLQVVIDPDRKEIYIAVPEQGSSFNTAILMADYKNGLSAEGVKWSFWKFASNPRSLGLFPVSKISAFQVDARLHIVTSPPTIYPFMLDANTLTDNSGPFVPVVTTAYIGYREGFVSLFNAIRLRISSSSVFSYVAVGVGGIDGSITGWHAFLPGATPTIEFLKKINFTAEKCRVQVQFPDSAVTSLQKVELHGRPRWKERVVSA